MVVGVGVGGVGVFLCGFLFGVFLLGFFVGCLVWVWVWVVGVWCWFFWGLFGGFFVGGVFFGVVVFFVGVGGGCFLWGAAGSGHHYRSTRRVCLFGWVLGRLGGLAAPAELLCRRVGMVVGLFVSANGVVVVWRVGVWL